MNRWQVLFVILLLALTPPALATYSIPASVFSNTGGFGASQVYSLTFVAGQGSPVGTAQGNGYVVYAGFNFTTTDAEPPLIGHSPASIVLSHYPLPIEATVVDARSGEDSVVLWFHEGGRSDFRSRRMQLSSDSTYTTTIPPSLVSERGLVYFIEAYDLAGNVSSMPVGAPQNLFSVRVWFEDLVSDFVLPRRQYRMISLPGSTNGSPDSVLVDDFGSYDRNVWRLGRWNPGDEGCSTGCYQEYPDIEDFAPGLAFWLISDQARSFDFSGMSLDISKPYEIKLEPGWNQIGTPFAFATDWPSVEVAYAGNRYLLGEEYVVGDDTIFVEDNLISYDGTYHGFQSQLRPWEGYWVYNASTCEVGLLVYPVAATPGMLAQAAQDIQPLVAIHVSKGDLTSTAFAGMSPQAKPSYDRYDLHAPPPIGDYVRVVFSDVTAKHPQDAFFRSIKPGTSDGAQWRFAVEASSRTPAKLDLEVLRPLPPGWQIALYDATDALRITQAELPYIFTVEDTRIFHLVMGSSEYIGAYEDNSNLNLRPRLISVNPNPFLGETSIRFFVPRASRVRLKIYSVAGQEIATLAERTFEPGIHMLNWDGCRSGGGRVSAGVYFLKFHCGSVSQSSKVVSLE